MTSVGREVKSGGGRGGGRGGLLTEIAIIGAYPSASGRACPSFCSQQWQWKGW